eukprot:750539-Hanusia_phi.AAC.1
MSAGGYHSCAISRVSQRVHVHIISILSPPTSPVSPASSSLPPLICSQDDETGKNMIKCWGLVDDGQIGYVNGQVVLIAAGGKLQFDGGLMMMMMALSSALLAFWR